MVNSIEVNACPLLLLLLLLILRFHIHLLSLPADDHIILLPFPIVSTAVVVQSPSIHGVIAVFPLIPFAILFACS